MVTPFGNNIYAVLAASIVPSRVFVLQKVRRRERCV